MDYSAYKAPSFYIIRASLLSMLHQIESGELPTLVAINGYLVDCNLGITNKHRYSTIAALLNEYLPQVGLTDGEALRLHVANCRKH